MTNSTIIISNENPLHLQYQNTNIALFKVTTINSSLKINEYSQTTMIVHTVQNENFDIDRYEADA